jgi:hypothetical protein
MSVVMRFKSERLPVPRGSVLWKVESYFVNFVITCLM